MTNKKKFVTIYLNESCGTRACLKNCDAHLAVSYTHLDKEEREELLKLRREPDITKDGREIEIYANIGNMDDLNSVLYLSLIHILSVYSSAEKLDWSYVEAARDLGASRMQAFFTIILKLTPVSYTHLFIMTDC